MANTPTIDRYPGPRPFGENEKILFFGRNVEIDELFQSINVHNLYVLHAESGLGKSSLINAGLIPKLEEKNFFPIIIRFKESKNETPVELVISKIRKSLPAINPLKEGENDYKTIWYWIKLYNRSNLYPVLIFDQFEEFAYFNPEERKELANELACLLASSIPNYIKEKPIADYEKTEGFSWFSQPEVKMIFSLRSDRLNVFQEFSEPIPSILRNCYQLKPLTLDQATKTILLPSVMESFGDIQFSSTPFNYTEGLIKDIMDVVKDNKTNTVETTHLQMICQEIEAIVRKRQQDNSVASQRDMIVTQEDLKGKKGLEELVKNFYNKQLEKISKNANISGAEYQAIRILIEKVLLIQRKRIPLAEGTVFQHFRENVKTGKTTAGDEIPPGIADKKIREIIDLLISLRLVRDQNYGGAVFYEIGHDTLINPIINEMKKREDEEDKKKQEAKKASLFRTFVIALVVLLVGLILMVFQAGKNYMDYKIAAANDHVFKQQYDSALFILNEKNIFTILQFNYKKDELAKLEDTANTFKRLEDQYYSNRKSGDTLFSIATNVYENVDSLLRKNSAEKVSGPDAEKIIEGLDGGKLTSAWDFYQQAQNIASRINYKPKTPVEEANNIDTKITMANERLSNAFSQSIDVIYFFLQKKDRYNAERAYLKATTIDSIAEAKDIELDPADSTDYKTLKKMLTK